MAAQIYFTVEGNMTSKVNIHREEAMAFLKENREQIINFWNSEFDGIGYYAEKAKKDYFKWLREYMQKIVDECNTRTRSFNICSIIRSAADDTISHAYNYYNYNNARARRQFFESRGL